MVNLVKIFFFALGLAPVYPPQNVFPQQPATAPIYPMQKIFPTFVIDGDTIPSITLPTLVVYPQRRLGNDRFSHEYIALARKVLKVYPYAKLAVRILDELEDTLKFMDSKSAQRRFLKAYEKALFVEYKEDLVKMKVSEGKILLKLIDRETGRTSYQLVEEFRGKMSAMFWQGVARLFGENLKERYDPKGEDRLIEEIVRKIEAGQLEPFPLPQKSQRKKKAAKVQPFYFINTRLFLWHIL